ncbi:hypothetical protein DACRYDRAFT_24238 [Dacryopinax primogenitus]|uniref:Uncharacterized protein n=1 Tax=Dacryopinax primogenitus (strain DJM 731) TaxID=1858805 RepID=M5G4F6_DACPD|nr:uncharacterized protein DACRYDRAFT_24238 [Dacryopinax primogenitus]EJT98627.1 hypothetical protein DACRYDRAFT_24238 [Dacryopinax primogenitus]
MNTTGDPTRWNEFLDAALFATRVRQQTTAKWSPFELLYGRKPRLPFDQPLLRAPDAALPGDAEHSEQHLQMQKAREEASEQGTIRALADKERWDHQLNIGTEGTQQPFEVGQKVLIRNETANKGDAHCFGPFVIRPGLVNGNRLRLAHLREDDTNHRAWVLPKATQRQWSKEDKEAASQAVVRAMPSIRIIRRFANPNTGSAPVTVTEDKTRSAPVTVAEDKAQCAPVTVAEDESQNTQ